MKYTFLLLKRESESTPGDFSLSVKDSDGVKHYRIRKLETGEYFISPRASFQSLEHLVYHYKFDADGLCCKESSYPLFTPFLGSNICKAKVNAKRQIL